MEEEEINPVVRGGKKDVKVDKKDFENVVREDARVGEKVEVLCSCVQEVEDNRDESDPDMEPIYGEVTTRETGVPELDDDP